MTTHTRRIGGIVADLELPASAYHWRLQFIDVDTLLAANPEHPPIRFTFKDGRVIERHIITA